MTFNERLEKVKGISIPEYMKEVAAPFLRDTGYYGSGEGEFEYGAVERCPVHNEDTASFRYYEETNTCSCFGCRFGGDIINLHRKFNSVHFGVETGFKDTVEWLYGKFIGGEDEPAATGVVEVAKKTEESAVENKITAMRYSARLCDVETRIRKLEKGQRRKKYEALDMLNRLVCSGSLSAADAMEALLKI